MAAVAAAHRIPLLLWARHSSRRAPLAVPRASLHGVAVPMQPHVSLPVFSRIFAQHGRAEERGCMPSDAATIGDADAPHDSCGELPVPSAVGDDVQLDLTIHAMNRNAREPNKANHGKRPCSNRRRKRNARKRLSDHPFLPLKSKAKKGYDY